MDNKVDYRKKLAEIIQLSIACREAHPEDYEKAWKAFDRKKSPDLVEPLGKLLTDPSSSPEDHFGAAIALGMIQDKNSTAPLLEAFINDPSERVRAEAAKSLGLIRDPAAIPRLVEALNNKEGDIIRRTDAAIALGHIGHRNCIAPLNEILTDKQNDELLRSSAAHALLVTKQKSVVPTLLRVIVEDELPRCDMLAEEYGFYLDFPGSLWQQKAEQVIQILQDGQQQRQNIKAANILKVMAPSGEKTLKTKRLLTSYLIDQAMDRDERMTAIMAALIIESADGSIRQAGELINEYQRVGKIPQDKLRKLRIQIGGERALDPILQRLEVDLQQYFQKPIESLNKLTESNWQKTILYAQYGFLVRIIMSVLVFLVGIGLLSVSSMQIIFGQMQPEQLWGPGVSLASGLGTMLLIIYTGPLKEIRKSVNDLGIASATFIAYVHRILEISHTFSYYYLKQRITFGEMRKSSELIQNAMIDIVTILNPKNGESVEKIIQRAMAMTSGRAEQPAMSSNPQN